TANLGKIIASTLKGMMGATLGNSVEGTSETAIENKPTNSSTPFIAIFDEVGYYTSQGMAVMAAQARSLGFSLVFAGQDLPALEKRVKEEARSITANCNIKLFGKLEDPTQTKDFFEKTVGTTLVTEVSGFQRGGPQGNAGNSYMDSSNASIQQRARASYDGLRGFTEGRAVCAFGKNVNEIQVYNSDIGHAKAMRVQRFLPIPPPAEEALDNLRLVDGILRRLRNPKWDAAAEPTRPNRDIEAMATGFAAAKQAGATLIECGVNAVASVAEAHETIRPEDVKHDLDSMQPMPEPDPEGERLAAQQVAAKTATGPLSWMEVIGASEDDAPAMPLRRDPPVIEEKKPVSWADVLGPEAASEVPGATPASPEVVQIAANAKLGAPLSWAEVIGAVPIETPVQQPQQPAAVPEAQTAPQVPADEPAGVFPLEPPVPWAQPTDDMAGVLPARAAELSKEREEAAARIIAEKTNGRAPMTWADVIGAAEDVINEKPDGN
ncbi:MAG: TraM recognition domain-containing protein, partial [Bdellovibrionales bacterium]|nr:TraM recognition domain-containing protein [Bdellovibrionales bacterium]